jgi:hypothetical protein
MQRPRSTLNIDLFGVGNTAAARYNARSGALQRPCHALRVPFPRLTQCRRSPAASLYQRLRALKIYAAAMPGNAAVVPNNETLLLTFFNAVPHAAKQRFGKMYGLPSDMAIPEFIRHSSRPSNSDSGSGNGNGSHNNSGDWNRHGNQSRRDYGNQAVAINAQFTRCFLRLLRALSQPEERQARRTLRDASHSRPL